MSETFGGTHDDTYLQTKLGRLTRWYHQMAMTLTEGAPNLITTLGAGTPAIGAGAVAASEQAGLLMDTADEAYGLIDVPGELGMMDMAKDLHAQIICEVHEASKANIDWGLWLKGVANGQLLSDAKVSADGSAAFVAMSNTSIGQIVVSERKALNVAGLFAADELIQMAVELTDKGTASADKVSLLAVRFSYTMQFASSTGSRERT
jgi:hypothetical protein